LSYSNDQITQPWLTTAEALHHVERIHQEEEAALSGQPASPAEDDLKPTNPKTAIGDRKVPLALCSPIAAAHWALAQFSGMCKYQAWNWRIAGVRSSTYV